MEELVEVHGQVIKRNIGGICTQYRINGGAKKVDLGQRVYSNGRFGPPDGKMGIVIGIHLPGENGHTMDIIQVWFEGEQMSLSMKYKDLQPSL